MVAVGEHLVVTKLPIQPEGIILWLHVVWTAVGKLTPSIFGKGVGRDIY